MKLQIYQVDAFTRRRFGGNPAAVVPLIEPLTAEQMQQIAAENNLSETAFYRARGAEFDLRWFTPAVEVKLCGHATLATAHILFAEKNYAGEELVFHTKSGILRVKKTASGYEMNFPADTLQEISDIPSALTTGLNAEIKEVWRGDTDWLVRVENRAVIEGLSPDFRLLGSLPGRGIIVTAPGDETDFVSRCFYPQAGIDEDPVTGSAHTTMTPYWAKQLGKNKLTARQISDRVGELECELQADRVLLRGNAVTYLRGEIEV